MKIEDRTLREHLHHELTLEGQEDGSLLLKCLDCKKDVVVFSEK